MTGRFLFINDREDIFPVSTTSVLIPLYREGINSFLFNKLEGSFFSTNIVRQLSEVYIPFFIFLPLAIPRTLL